MLLNFNHHATLIVHHDRKLLTEKYWKELQVLSPAHIIHNHTVFDIDTARSLISWTHAPYDKEKIALLSFHTMTLPAQNALLKILEEPRVGVRFVIITTNKEALIPTFLSRLQEHTLSDDQSQEKNQDLALLFLQTKKTARMELPEITKLLSKCDEEGRKDRESVRQFILSLLTHTKESPTIFTTTHAKEILDTASFSSDPSSSLKALIEYLSLLLPEVKD